MTCFAAIIRPSSAPAWPPWYLWRIHHALWESPAFCHCSHWFRYDTVSPQWPILLAGISGIGRTGSSHRPAWVSSRWWASIQIAPAWQHTTRYKPVSLRVPWTVFQSMLAFMQKALESSCYCIGLLSLSLFCVCLRLVCVCVV